MLVNQICNQALKQTVWMHVYITHKRIILVQGDSNSSVYETSNGNGNMKYEVG